MKYPIDVETYLQSARRFFEIDVSTEQFIRNYVPMVNRAYFDGKAGNAGYPIDPEHEIYRRATDLGMDSVDEVVFGVLADVIRIMNAAYAQGELDAKEVA